MQAIQLGPLSISLTVLLLIAAIIAGSYAGQWQARRRGTDIEPWFLSRIILPALLLARLAYVLQYSPSYFEQPLSILDIRDGGFNPWAGLAVAWLLALRIGWQRPAIRSGLLTALATSSLIGVCGLFWLDPARQQVPLPALSFSQLDGRPRNLQDFAGKPVVLNLWATWCPHCVREMPVLADAGQRYPDIEILFLNQGESAAQIQRYLARHPVPSGHMLLDPERQAGRHFGQIALPTTLFFDRRGTLVDIRVGALSQATLQQRIQRLLGPD